MSIHDLRTFPSGTNFRADIALIGGGPVGITIARELSKSRCRVLLIESGGPDFCQEHQVLNAVENVGEPIARAGAEPLGRGYNGGLAWLNDVAPFELRNRTLGGSSHTWIGKCASFDEIDFERRPWLPVSGWPMTRENLSPALAKAADLLNLGPNVYDESLYRLLRTPPRGFDFDADLLRPFFWQFSHERDRRGEPMRFGRMARDLDAPNVDVLSRATVTAINLDRDARRVISLDIRAVEGVHATVQAATVVLCAGGIENARLLLASNAVMKSGVGNSRDVVGRYLADHPRAAIARFVGPDIDKLAGHFNFYGLSHQGRPHFYLHGMRLSPHVQRRDGLVNCAAYPVQVHAAGDPWAAVKRLMQGGSTRLFGDLATALRSPGLLAQGAFRRLVQKRGMLHRSDELRFDVMAEQRLDADSRVTLSEQRDLFGTPLPRVNWKIGEAEVESIKRLAHALSSQFVRNGLPALRLAAWIAENDDGKAVFTDMAHPSCTTRMGTDPSVSVVDPDAMVHGVDGLFIAGSSVFPTPGHANPTLMALALAIRLADHLKARNERRSVVELRRQVAATGR
ncbi:MULTISPECIES: GMC family oxidoreductase [Sinorhizobium]|uniref:GMC oxidoreductase n=1 Tax=Sinorhizobium TaxID=28105 RepID=UPI000BE98C8E|nr:MULTISPECIES: GMC family oxidoreductase [Sinorhizobium]PDT53045.1 glucose-methanol-choline oxidoreductase [Sinorhizobium sp. NG07B]POH29213.1 glucose-methanol-choline oxidoreductase [Sinorhizobium americanum]